MSVEAQDVGQDEASALAEVMAGYTGKARGDEPPADAAPPAGSQTSPEDNNVADPAIVDPPQPETDTDSPTPSIEDELKALKEKVATIKDSGADAAMVRRMYGEIGNINRTLQQLQQQPKDEQQQAAPSAFAELDAAIANAEAVAKDWPELAGPQVSALKQMRQALEKATGVQAPAVDTNAITQLVDSRVTQERVAMHVEILDGLVPGWETVVGLPDEKGVVPQTPYRAWLATQPAEYQTRLNNTNNAFEIKASIDKFNAATAAAAKANQKKQDRLATNVVQRNTAAPVPSVLPDEAGFEIGYKRADKQLRRI